MSASHLSLLALAGVLGADAALQTGCDVIAPCPAQVAVAERTELEMVALMAARKDVPAPVRIAEPVEVVQAPVAEVLSHSRWVEGNTLVSTGLPEMTVDIDPAFSFVGSTRYELVGELAAEAFIFAEQADNEVARTLTFVFEGALPDSDFAYDFTPSDTVMIADEAYAADALFAWGMHEAVELFPEQDNAIHRNLIGAAGLQQADDMLIQRFVRTTNEDSTAQCIIAYAEDLASLGKTEAELEEGGRFNHMIPEIETSLRERALASFTVQSSQ
jgi:hypothetical protein